MRLYTRLSPDNRFYTKLFLWTVVGILVAGVAGYLLLVPMIAVAH